MKIKIGTRKSKLALAQTEMFAKALQNRFKNTEIEIVHISTKGDKILDKPLAMIGGKGVFISELENALLSGEADMAVHSARINCIDYLSAIRAARGYTKRDKIVKFEGCYHGHSDGLLVKSGSGLLTNSIPDSAGVPKEYTDNTLLAKYNNKESVEKLFEEHGDDIACVIVEPCAANMGVVPPEKGFLQFLREITTKYNSLLIFDEVITGFRLSIGGAQQYYNVTPDLTTLGKIVGGGMPLAVYGGKKEVMQCVAPLGSVYQAGTLSGNPVAVSAGIETLKILEENQDEIYTRLEKISAQLENAMQESGLNVNRVGSIMTVFFTGEKVKDYDTAKTADTARFAEYFRHMQDSGVYTAPSQFEAMFVSFAHTDEDIDKTINAIKSLE